MEQIRSWYRKRFSQEHSYRFLKQDLLWDKTNLRTPEQVERWSWLLAAVCNQLLVSKQLGLAQLRPWESQHRAVTPQQVRRVMLCILQQVGTPARSPKLRGKSLGWQKGRLRTRIALYGDAQTQTDAQTAPQTGLKVSPSWS